MATNQKTIIFRPITAKLTRDTDMFSNMDPYVKFKIGKTKVKTSVAKNAGKTPSWKDELSITYSNEDSLKIEVWDKDLLKSNDLIGGTVLGLSALEAQQEKDQVDNWIELTYKGKYAGKLLCYIQFAHQKQTNNQCGFPTTTTTPMPEIKAQTKEPVHQHQPITEKQQNVVDNSTPQQCMEATSSFKPGQWPRNANIEWADSVVVPQNKSE